MTGTWGRGGAALVGGGLLGLGLAFAAVPVLVVVAFGIVGTLLLMVSQRLLWVLMLVVFAALPLAYLPVPDALLTVSPAVLVVLVLGLRAVLDGRGPRATVIGPAGLLVLALAGWLAVTVASSPYRAVSVGWFVSYACLATLPALLAMRDPRVRDVVSRTWVVLGAVLGAYALVETFVLQANPLLDRFYSAGADPLVQEWSVYRATTTLGHPVSNGSFFTVAVPLALGAAVHRRSGAAALAALLAAGGVVASGSRSAFAATLVGAAVVVLLPGARRDGRAPAVAARAAGALAIGVALVLGSAYLAVRDDSGEGGTSAAFRVTQVPIALQRVAESPVLGTGPGAASLSQESLLARVGGAGAFESYWLELAVGAGIPGLLLGAAVLVAAVVAAVRTGAPEVAGAVLAWTVSVTFVNALEGGRPEHLVHGLVLALAFSSGSAALGGRSTPGADLPDRGRGPRRQRHRVRAATAVRLPTGTGTGTGRP